jgi:V8-like Glu-specific endopeptidase
MPSIDQQRVPDPAIPPLDGVCHLFVTRRKGLVLTTYNNSSGAILDGRHVLTAAHNVHSTRLSEVRSIEVSVGRTRVDGAATVRVVDQRVASQYGWRKFAHDYAVLRLAAPVAVPEPFGLPSASLEPAVSQVRIAGYPGASGGERDGKHMFAATGPGRRAPDGPFLDYDIDTETGNSGGPVWIEQDGTHPVIVGVHVTELQGTSGRARYCDPEMVHAVRAMIAELEAAGR